MSKSSFFTKPNIGLARETGTSVAPEGSSVKLLPPSVAPAPCLGRAFRFPSSRKFLWDRTPLGRLEVVEAKDILPTIRVRSDFHSDLSANDEVVVAFSCNDGQRLQAHVSKAAGEQQHTSDARVITPVISRAGSAASGGTLQDLVAVVQHSLDVRGPTRLTTGMAVGVALHVAGSADGGPTGSNGGAAATMTVTLLVPEAALNLTPLYGKRLCDVPLAQSLSREQATDNSIQTGYLTMDQARSLLPLSADDNNVYSVPLVGVWVRGARGPEQPAVYSTALRFAYSSTLPDRATQPDGAFLLLLFTGDSPVARCYEARFTDGTLTAPGGGGLKLLPYVVKAELACQTDAPLELRPVLDTQAAAADGGRLMIHAASAGAAPAPSASAAPSAQIGLHPAVTQQRGINGVSGLTALPGGAGASYSKYDVHGMLQLRGSGSKLMTSPSKAMKILTQANGSGLSGVATNPSSDPGLGLGLPAVLAGGTHACRSAPHTNVGAQYVHGAGGQRDSPPMPRSSALPTPFRPVWPHMEGGGVEHEGGFQASGLEGDNRFEGFAPPQDPRLQHGSSTTITPTPPPTSGVGDNGRRANFPGASEFWSTRLRGDATFRPPSAQVQPAGAMEGPTDWSADPTVGVMSTPSAIHSRQSAPFASTPNLLRNPHQQPWQPGRMAPPPSQAPGAAVSMHGLPGASSGYAEGGQHTMAGGMGPSAGNGSGVSSMTRSHAHSRYPAAASQSLDAWLPGVSAGSVAVSSPRHPAVATHDITMVAFAREPTALHRPCVDESIAAWSGGQGSSGLVSHPTEHPWLQQTQNPGQASTTHQVRSVPFQADGSQDPPPAVEAQRVPSSSECSQLDPRLRQSEAQDAQKFQARTDGNGGSSDQELGEAVQGPALSHGSAPQAGRPQPALVRQGLPPPGSQTHDHDLGELEHPQQQHDLTHVQRQPVQHLRLLSQLDAAATTDATQHDNLPSDPMLLRQEVIMLRRQVAELQQRLELMATLQQSCSGTEDSFISAAASSAHAVTRQDRHMDEPLATLAAAPPVQQQEQSLHLLPPQQRQQWSRPLQGSSCRFEDVSGAAHMASTVSIQTSQREVTCSGREAPLSYVDTAQWVHEQQLRQRQSGWQGTIVGQERQPDLERWTDGQPPRRSGPEALSCDMPAGGAAGHLQLHTLMPAAPPAPAEPDLRASTAPPAADITAGQRLAEPAQPSRAGGECRTEPSGQVGAPPAGCQSDRMSVSAWDRGSVWSMASLRSSVLSCQSSRNLGAGSSAANIPRRGSSVAAAPAMEGRALQAPACELGPSGDGMTAASSLLPVRTLGLPQAGCEGPRAPAAVSSTAMDASNANGSQGQELGAVAQTGHGTKYMRLSSTGSGWRRKACGTAGSGRRRMRGNSSDSSDGDLSSTSDMDDENCNTVKAARPATSVARREAPVEQLDSARTALGAYEAGHGSIAGPLDGREAPDAHVPVVLTKYIPLDDDTDSSDSESELLLMQKYGIRV